MKTLLQCINELIDNISVTDRQESNIKGSISNLTTYLTDSGNGLSVEEIFTNGSYERDTIIRPLDDIDLFAVLNKDKWKDQYGNLPNPQSVLSKIKNYLDSLNDYKDKVSQDRPCVTVKLSDKNFDVLPSFSQGDGGYWIPNYNLDSWTLSYPLLLTKDLDDSHRNHNYRIKPLIKTIKYWNRENSKIIPSYHVEEATINMFKLHKFNNYEEAIRTWFNNAEYHLIPSKFRSNDNYLSVINKIKKVKDKLNNAYELYNNKKEAEAIKIWKDIFGKEFPTVDIEEADKNSKALSEGSLKIGSTGLLSTTLGKNVPVSKGFFGEK